VRSIASISEHAAKAYAGRAHPVDPGQRDLRLGSVGAMLIGHPGPGEPSRIARPTLGQEQPQADHDGHFA